MTVLLGIPRCDHCGFESRLYELDDGTRLICKACVCALVDVALAATDTRCVHSRSMDEYCLACEIMRAGTQPS